QSHIVDISRYCARFPLLFRRKQVEAPPSFRGTRQSFEFSHSLTPCLAATPTTGAGPMAGGWYKDLSELACGRRSLEGLFVFFFRRGRQCPVPMYLCTTVRVTSNRKPCRQATRAQTQPHVTQASKYPCTAPLPPGNPDVR